MAVEWWLPTLAAGVAVLALALQLFRLVGKDKPITIKFPRRRLTAADFDGRRRGWAKSALVVAFGLLAIVLGANGVAASLGPGELGDLLAGIGGVVAGTVGVVLAWWQIRKDRRGKISVSGADSTDGDSQWTPGELFLLYQVLNAQAERRLKPEDIAALNTLIGTLGKGKSAPNGSARVVFNGSIEGGVRIGNALDALKRELPEEQYNAIEALIEPVKELPLGDSDSTGGS
ncbi:hypothetical protein AB0G05_11375 [Nonomuraea wenchangensis]